jgi:hypothetical protein
MGSLEDILIPLAFFAACVLIIYFGVQLKLKRLKMEHEERIMAIEKGVAVPQMPAVNHHHTRNPYAWPLVLIGIGLAWMIAKLFDGDTPGWSLLPLLMGVGLLAARHLYKKHHPNNNHAVINGGDKLPQ